MGYSENSTKAEKPPTERRRSERQTMKGAAVLCYNAEFTGSAYDMYNVATHLVDVGPSGACIVSVGRLRPGIQMIIDLTFPRTKDHIKAKAKVRWSESVVWRDRDVNLTGLEFVRILQSSPSAMQLLSGGSKHSDEPAGPKAPASVDPRRQSRRFPVDGAETACFPSGLLASIGFGGNTAQGLVNLSAGGCQIACNKKMKPGRAVRLKIRIKQFGDLIEGTGRICWCRLDTLSWKHRWLSGVAFTKLDEKSEKILKTLTRWYESQAKS